MSYMTTYSGHHFDPCNPDISLINIEDIAHSLSLQCRANGHYPHLYTVAQHCINCAHEAKERNFSSKVQLACLLHDASEAYVSDMIRPIKYLFPDYIALEDSLLDIIFALFIKEPLSDEEKQIIKDIDDAILEYEFNHLMKESYIAKAMHCISTPDIVFHNPAEVEYTYKMLFNSLTKA